ncbi:MAG: hypothetical protein FWF44_00075 [Defluviitaleaceae bacterium]|nr:hypothetical protein [Defluviitaleaceae bacterium]
MNWAEVKRINSNLQVPLDTTLGQRADAAATTQGTGFSVIAYLKGILGAANIIGKASPTAADTTTVMNYIKTLENEILARPVSPVKNVQRGVYRSPNMGQATDATVSIVAVNMSKALLFYTGTNGAGAELTGSGVITVHISTGVSTIYWQVIEFN